MKRLIIIFITFSLNLFAQQFDVVKVNGKVEVLKGTSEKWVKVKTGDVLKGSDLILTEKNSSVQLRKNENYFLLKSNSALGLNKIKNISINELLLALTMEEVRSVPANSNPNIKSSAVYGSNQSAKNNAEVKANQIGFKRINGAKQLAENGYAESAIIFAKETFRKYPETSKSVSDRLYFAELIESLNLNEEALSEYSKINSLNLNDDEQKLVNAKLQELTVKTAK